MKIQIDTNDDLVITPETEFEQIYISNWYRNNSNKPSKETIIFALMEK